MISVIIESSMDTITVMFIIGFIIFTLYICGLVYVIYHSHQQQRYDLENDPELEGFDWDNYHRNRVEKFNIRPIRKKKNVGKKMYWD